VGTFGNGLMRFQAGRSHQFAPTVGSPARIDKVTALLEDRRGDVWVGTYYSLYKGTETNWVVPVSVGERELRAPVAALIESRNGGLWAACHGLGVLRLGARGTNWITRHEGLPTHLVRALHEDADGSLWIGTEAGLCWWRDGRITTFTTEHGLTDSTVSQILDDGAGHLWLGSRRGLMRIARLELSAVAEGRQASAEVLACGHGEGMLSEECSGGFSPAGLRSTDGRLWFPTARGLVMVDPAEWELGLNPSPPPVHLEEVRADGRLVARPHVAPGPVQARQVARHAPAGVCLHRAEPDGARACSLSASAGGIRYQLDRRRQRALDGLCQIAGGPLSFPGDGVQ
jgi:hypothetical protein